MRSSDIASTPAENPKPTAKNNEMSVISASRSKHLVCDQQAARVLNASAGSVRQRTSRTRGGGDRGAIPDAADPRRTCAGVTRHRLHPLSKTRETSRVQTRAVVECAYPVIARERC